MDSSPIDHGASGTFARPRRALPVRGPLLRSEPLVQVQETRGPALFACTLLSLAAFACLVWRFDFLCDDAYISFRYARNLAEGHGLTYNPGDAPVEGFSNLLWVLLLALAEALQLAPELVSRVLGVACGVGLLFSVRAHLARNDGRSAAVGTIFLAALPPVAVWSTGGLATVPFALALFELHRAVSGRERLGARGALAGLAVVLLRADGFVWAALVAGLAGIRSWRARDAAGARRVGRALAVCAAVVAGVTLFRLGYYGRVGGVRSVSLSERRRAGRGQLSDRADRRASAEKNPGRRGTPPEAP